MWRTQVRTSCTIPTHHSEIANTKHSVNSNNGEYCCRNKPVETSIRNGSISLPYTQYDGAGDVEAIADITDWKVVIEYIYLGQLVELMQKNLRVKFLNFIDSLIVFHMPKSCCVHSMCYSLFNWARYQMEWFLNEIIY